MNKNSRKKMVVITSASILFCLVVSFVLLKLVTSHLKPLYHNQTIPYYRGIVQTESGYTLYDDSGVKITDTYKYIDFSDVEAHKSRYVRFEDENISGILDCLSGTVKYSTSSYILPEAVEDNFDMYKPIIDKISKKTGMVNLLNGEIIVNPEYDYLIKTDLGDTIGLQSTNLYLVDPYSNEVTIIGKRIDEVMQLFGGKVLATKSMEGGTYQLINTAGDPVCDMRFSKIEINADNKVTGYFEGEQRKPVTIMLALDSDGLYMNLVDNCFLSEENEYDNSSEKKDEQAIEFSQAFINQHQDATVFLLYPFADPQLM
ncbi:hypothetical protein [Hespellia stercorisuis]|uniref:Uncharacterized protein n=1 Tax=Hespellia stercorisuis DSM 15480 TaxID=1121950 RepID=A0A1M6V5B3_9FIRM|nr:hypothetical protein [Hespellia stercorisuis]SHK76660.1 hypothetical protein SAMN02745243_03686 [Hespellia stercorisuis DSM 15480]